MSSFYCYSYNCDRSREHGCLLIASPTALLTYTLNNRAAAAIQLASIITLAQRTRACRVGRVDSHHPVVGNNAKEVTDAIDRILINRCLLTTGRSM
jgi:hypothetical protein